MTDLKIRPCRGNDSRRRYVSDGPIDFETWLKRSLAADKSAPETELVRGVIIDRMSAQYPHEWIIAWLSRIIGSFTEQLKLGVVLGSRSAVKISGNDGRLPDLLFVRAENVQIIRKDAIYGAPDLIVEVISENDRPYILVPLEADYRAIGVPEIVFIDPKRRRVRYLRRTDLDSLAGHGSKSPGVGENPAAEPKVNDIGDFTYDEAFLYEGPLEFTTIPGFHIEIAWLFADDRPAAFTVTKQLIEAAESQSVR